jgi:branched-chain amino acid aminotransferase
MCGRIMPAPLTSADPAPGTCRSPGAPIELRGEGIPPVRPTLNSPLPYTRPMSAHWAYYNGEWISSAELRVGVDDLGFLLGATVTERLRTFRGDVFRLEEHMRRLRRSLEIVGLEADAIANRIVEAIPEFVRRNRQQIDKDDDWSIVAFVTPGVAGGGRPTICVHGYPLQFGLWAEHFERGVRVVVSDVRQIPPDCLPPELKCRSRMHFYLADWRAAQRQPGARAILLDEDGFVAEASTANVLVYRESEGLISPPPEHILFGVSVHVVQELAAKLGTPFITRPLTVEELQSSSEAMLTSTSVCLLPIVQCDGRAIGEGRPGPMYHQLLKAWSEMVGLDVAAQARQFANRPA